MKQKGIITVLIILLCVPLLYAQSDKNKRKQQKAEKMAEAVTRTQRLVDAGIWRFSADRVLPATGNPRTLVTDYAVVLNKDTVDSYLPYFGRAYSVDYGNTQSPMVFKAPVEDYRVEKTKHNGWRVSFKARNKNDWVEFSFDIGKTGQATLHVNSTNRRYISYTGTLEELEEKSGAK